MGYENKYDLMDQNIFPKESIYILKENPKADSRKFPRVDKTDEEIVAAVVSEMNSSLGVELEP